MYVVLPAAFGVRMCFHCPDCNTDDDDQSIVSNFCACSDYLGANSKLMGGFVGLGIGLGFATEFQGDATPHGHGFASLANMYQHSTLEEIRDIIESNVKKVPAEEMQERLIQFIDHIQREDHIDDEAHQNSLHSLEKEFHNANEGPKQNKYLSVRPRTFYEYIGKPYLWGNVTDKIDTITSDVLEEAEQFRSSFEADVQFIFSHVQHHWHLQDKKGKRQPMKYCRPTGRNCQRCKRDFPKKVMTDAKGKVRMDRYRTRIVCRGVAAELDLRISGRRNALGSFAGKRRCAYFSSTSALLAHVARSNSNIQCNYRVPVTNVTHDKDCKAPSCTKMMTTRRLCLIAQRAMKQMTGYFGGYISKKQKIGQFEIKKSVSTLPLLQQKLEDRQLKTASAQLAHIVNRMFTTLEGKGILRACTEEFLLSSRYKPHDPLAAEFIRTFRHQNFPGKFFLDRYEALAAGKHEMDVRVLLPKQAAGKGIVDMVSLYGFRPRDSPCFFLSPWEFVQWVTEPINRKP